MKTVKAVEPYSFKSGYNFKKAPFEAWVKCGGQIAKAHYPAKPLHGLFYRWELPSLWINHKEARLRFMEPVSLHFDTFPDYTRYEIIPFVWDCWPQYFEMMCRWLKKHRVKTAIFTSSQTAEKMKSCHPDMNILFVPEGINTEFYPEGNSLVSRSNRLYEIGSGKRCFLKSMYPQEYARLSTLPLEGLLDSKQDYIKALCDAQITITFPRCDMMREETGEIETLTQRYWESMLTRSVIIGRAPKELVNLIGFNPVIDMDMSDPIGQIDNVLEHIDEYQSLVDKNRTIALEFAPWERRMKVLSRWLRSCGYNCSIVA